MHPLIFVYGTLRPASGHPMAAWLAGRSRRLGPASVTGRLYRVGHYPGLVAGEGQVRGDLLEMDAAGLEATVAGLDAYEGEEFRRELGVVRLGGSERQAWIYWYAPGAGALPCVESGDWLQP